MARGEELKKQRFIEWLCTPKRERDPSTQEGLAREMHVNPNKLSEWKKDADFVRAWESHYLTTIGSPERKQTLLDTLYRTGSDADDPRHVSAAKTYMDIVEGLKPQQIELIVKRPAAELTDDQIDEIVAQHAERERNLRLVEGG